MVFPAFRQGPNASLVETSHEVSRNALSCSAAEGWKSCYDRRRPLNPGGGAGGGHRRLMCVLQLHRWWNEGDEKNVCGLDSRCSNSVLLSLLFEMVSMTTYKDVAGKKIGNCIIYVFMFAFFEGNASWLLGMGGTGTIAIHGYKHGGIEMNWELLPVSDIPNDDMNMSYHVSVSKLLINIKPHDVIIIIIISSSSSCCCCSSIIIYIKKQYYEISMCILNTVFIVAWNIYQPSLDHLKIFAPT